MPITKRIAACRSDDFLSCRRFWATAIDSGFKNNRTSTRVGPVTTDVKKGLFFFVLIARMEKHFPSVCSRENRRGSSIKAKVLTVLEKKLNYANSVLASI